jgi:tRNA modification GTPase
MADADLVIVILDASEPLTAADHDILESVADLNFIVAANKIDKSGTDDNARDIADISGLAGKVTRISAKTGAGLDGLRASILAPFAEDLNTAEGFLVTDARHHDLLLRTADELERSLTLLGDGLSEEIVLIGLHNAIRYLGEITGETTTEDMLTRIFSTFCIGK